MWSMIQAPRVVVPRTHPASRVASHPRFCVRAPEMGFLTTDVLSEEGHYGEFLCSICQQLSDMPAAVTLCNHVFCPSCLDEWPNETLHVRGLPGRPRQAHQP